MNPYAPSQATADNASPGLPASAVVGLFIGGLILIAAICCAVYIPYLHIAYPGLIDPAAYPETIDYWPEIDVAICYVVLVLGFLIGMPVFLFSLSSWRNSRRSQDQINKL